MGEDYDEWESSERHAAHWAAADEARLDEYLWELEQEETEWSRALSEVVLNAALLENSLYRAVLRRFPEQEAAKTVVGNAGAARLCSMVRNLYSSDDRVVQLCKDIGSGASSMLTRRNLVVHSVHQVVSEPGGAKRRFIISRDNEQMDVPELEPLASELLEAAASLEIMTGSQLGKE